MNEPNRTEDRTETLSSATLLRSFVIFSNTFLHIFYIYSWVSLCVCAVGWLADWLVGWFVQTCETRELNVFVSCGFSFAHCARFWC